jgi:hypothetical protein
MTSRGLGQWRPPLPAPNRSGAGSEQALGGVAGGRCLTSGSRRGADSEINTLRETLGFLKFCALWALRCPPPDPGPAVGPGSV